MAVSALLEQIRECNRRSIAESGDISPENIATILELAIDTSPNRHELMVGLGEFIGAAISGAVPDPHTL